MGLIYNYLENVLFLAFYYLDNLHIAFKHFKNEMPLFWK